MGAKKKVISGFMCFGLSRHSADALFADVIEAVKEECCSGNIKWGWSVSKQPEPQLIQGYTAEQWQEIIDGGYLCEYSQNGIHWSKAKWPLEKFHELKGGLFEGDMEKRSFCRPAQIKGVMRPIFVEPVDDDDARCVFFSESGTPLHSNIGWGYRFGCGQPNATKYIEL